MAVTRQFDAWGPDNLFPILQLGDTGNFAWWAPGDAFPVVHLDPLPEVLARDAQLPLDWMGAVPREARLPVEFLSGVPAVVFLNWLAGGGGAPVWWREIPTPAYVKLAPRTPAAHLRDRARRRRRGHPRRPEPTVAVVEGRLVVEPPRLEEALRRLYRRRLARAVRGRLDLVESDEEFLVVTGVI